uniref:Uncharacterized protein n=1 Tax=Arundo donax TaxID=35708 RepID=A0A0A9GGH0_ARUDO
MSCLIRQASLAISSTPPHLPYIAIKALPRAGSNSVPIFTKQP